MPILLLTACFHPFAFFSRTRISLSRPLLYSPRLCRLPLTSPRTTLLIPPLFAFTRLAHPPPHSLRSHLVRLGPRKSSSPHLLKHHPPESPHAILTFRSHAPHTFLTSHLPRPFVLPTPFYPFVCHSLCTLAPRLLAPAFPYHGVSTSLVQFAFALLAPPLTPASSRRLYHPAPMVLTQATHANSSETSSLPRPMPTC